MASGPLRLRLDGAALADNWRWLKARGGAAQCGAAVKADGYGLGAVEATRRLAAAGCRFFFVSNWAEAAAIEAAAGDASVAVLHGVGPEDMAAALASRARPVLNSPEQVARWKETGRPCDLMVDTGIHRLGLAPEQATAELLGGLAVDTLMSHLACADEQSCANRRQLDAFRALAERLPAARRSLANSAGICLGPDYAFDLTRPGLALYGGVPRAEAQGAIRQVAWPQARVVQRKRVPAGGCVGYNATWTASRDCEIAVANIGYADGYRRGFSGRGEARFEGAALPVLGRVSMDLVTLGCDAAPHLREGDWIELDFDLPRAAALTGISQYELLTGLGGRLERVWD